jgi:hypothetical protein
MKACPIVILFILLQNFCEETNQHAILEKPNNLDEKI